MLWVTTKMGSIRPSAAATLFLMNSAVAWLSLEGMLITRYWPSSPSISTGVPTSSGVIVFRSSRRNSGTSRVTTVS